MTGVRWLDAVAGAAAAAAVIAILRRRCLRWAASDEEVGAALPGDELLPHADLTATRAITVRTRPDGVWPWIVQLGQGRGGFYSYDLLENLAGCNIHSADRIVAQWQSINVGATVKLHPDVGLIAAIVEPRRALVLRGGVQMGKTPAPYEFTWAFVLRDQANGTTRLVVRERYRYARRWATLIVEPTQLISLVMSWRMLRGIKERAERPAATRDDPAVATDPARCAPLGAVGVADVAEQELAAEEVLNHERRHCALSSSGVFGRPVRGIYGIARAGRPCRADQILDLDERSEHHAQRVARNEGPSRAGCSFRARPARPRRTPRTTRMTSRRNASWIAQSAVASAAPSCRSPSSASHSRYNAAPSASSYGSPMTGVSCVGRMRGERWSSRGDRGRCDYT